MIGTGSVIGLDERVHAKIAGENCYGPAKLRMIADWVEASGLKGTHGHVRFYSDHVSDQPAFEWADEPVAVNPHGKLRRLAEQRGWQSRIGNELPDLRRCDSCCGPQKLLTSSLKVGAADDHRRV